MMNSSTENMMMYLVGFIVVLIFSIAIPIAISLLKKKKPIEIAKSIGPDTENKALVQTETETEAEAAAVAEAPVVTEVTSEKEVSVLDALKKTEENFFGRIKNAFSKNRNDLKKVLDEIEEILYTSDLGPKTVERLLTKVSEDLSKSEMMDLTKIKSALESEMNLILSPVHAAQINSKSVIDLISKAPAGPTVLMVVGVNGAGKTTSIGKITSQLAAANQKVLVAAGDTFRAAAGGQLKVWTDRASSHSGSEGLVEIFWPENTNDPAAVAFDAVTKAKAKNFDYVILDTAGRLHTQSNLMDELKKVKRVMTKVIDSAPHETWIVLDANSGQNALNQAVEFNKALELTGVVLTKMDGTAKGGVALGVVDQLQKPIKLIGIGEKIGDLRVFNQTEYIESILGRG